MKKAFARLQKNTIVIGLIFTILSAIASLALGIGFFAESRFEGASYFHAGVDVMGAFVCAMLFYGCMGQVEEHSRSFSILVIMTSLSFLINELMWFTAGTATWRNLYFICCLLSKLLNLSMIYYFYRYVRNTLNFREKLADWADRCFPILLIVFMAVVLGNIFAPVSFQVSDAGVYARSGAPWLEDIYLSVVSVITTILICRCGAGHRQKWAAMSFILIPIAEFLVSGGAFAYSAQYGAVLLSLILMYCILFNARSRRLAATQTELNMATGIQKAMLPSIFPAFPERKEFDLYASMRPAREVGGDFYDFFLIDEDHLALIIADVSGKGVPAALFMMISKTILQNFAKLGIEPADILQKANEALCEGNRTEMFVTVWIGILEISTGKMSCANAGHEYPSVCRDGRFELFKDRHGFVLGGMQGVKFRSYEIQLNRGDKLFVYTDGVPEATNSDKDMFGTDGMLDALNRRADAAPANVLETVQNAVDAFVGDAEQFDDLTMLCLEYHGMEA